jgi:hypothetical protein
MKALRILIPALLSSSISNRTVVAAEVSAPAAPTAPVAAGTPPAPTPRPTARPIEKIRFPGKGLGQHDFLYSGEWDTRNPMETMFLVRGGKVVWTYQIPDKDPRNGQLSEFSDMHRLSNGDIVFAYKTGWRKIDKDGRTIYDFYAPRGETGWKECHTAQPIGMDRVMYMLNGVPAKLYVYNIREDRIEREQVVETKEPVDQKSVHAQFRNVRMTKDGTFLISHLNLGKVVEYDKDWKPIWSVDAPSVWHAVRLKNGNTLASGNQHAWAREYNPKGEIVWELKDGDIPPYKINSVHQAHRLANGNTVICNWTAGVNKVDWPGIVQVIEVTPDKKVVWAFREWNKPDLGPSSLIQLLDEPGKDEEMELQ